MVYARARRRQAGVSGPGHLLPCPSPLPRTRGQAQSPQQPQSARELPVELRCRDQSGPAVTLRPERIPPRRQKCCVVQRSLALLACPSYRRIVVNASAEGSPSHAPNGSSRYCQRLFHPERRTQLFWSPSCRLWARSFRCPMQRQRERVTAQPHVGSKPIASAPRARRRFGHASSARCGTSTASLVRLACAGRSVRLPGRVESTLRQLSA